MKMLRSVCLGVLLYCAIPIPVAIVLTSCTGPQQRITYNSLFSVEKSGVALYDGYLDLVIAKKVKPDSVPNVSRAFNKFQVAMREAIQLANFNSNAPPSVDAIMAVNELNVAITQAKQTK